ncbi:MAG: cation-translocating P-type ATPase, partial [Firmicutes bacterium]|nr:cation-translocating P-type ATPase [Bacillota bacterium]
VVVTTGMRTELGRIARLLGEVKTEKTSLQKQLDHIGKKITHPVVVSVGAIAVIFLARGRSVLEVLRTGISLAVGAVPEGLPAVLTVALSTGIQRMVKRNAIVRNMSAVETLGSTTVICADKTGTLTKNEMTVKQLYIDNNFYDVSGYGYKPIGKIMLKGRENQEGNISLVREILKASVLCNNAELRPGAKGQWVVIGDPTEGALLTAAAKAGIWWHDLRNKFRRQQEIAFDTKRRIMTVICREFGDKQGVYVKGAPDAVINHCNTVIQDNKVRSLNSEIRKNILDSSESMAGEALRVLAIAYKILPKESNLNREDLESELTFCGLIGMSDSPREGVKEAIHKCRNAGVKVVMITGDHRKTAEAIASRLGILNQGKSITGKELDNIPDTEFSQKVEDFVVYSRTTPEQKLRIVRALKNRGQIVAMTGDGVNDAPAIKEADIGIAMGLSGTDVTREVAGMVLSDDNFVTIVNGIEEGRTVGMNLSKSLRYILSGSVGQLVMVFSSAALGLPAPLLPTQILWINLVTESLPAMALTADPPEGNYMNQPPLSPKGRFLPYQGRTILQKGVLFGICTFGLFSYGLMKGKWSLDKARTMAFSQLVINRIFNLINERKTAASKLQSVSKNPLILPAAATTVLMLAATMYLPFLSPLFSAVPIGLKDWGLLVTHA